MSAAGGLVAGAARLELVAGVSLLRPEEQVFDAMLAGWAGQQAARNLSFGTIENRQRAARAFAAHAGCPPWQWSAQLVDEWCTDLRAVRRLARSTVRNYTESVRLLCDYLTDSAYEWPAECESRFGTHPVQVFHEWNTAVHVQQCESGPAKRAFTVGELEAFFDYADEQVEAIRSAGRKGWWPAFRDATLFKAAYGFGLFSRVRSVCWSPSFSRLCSSEAVRWDAICRDRCGARTRRRRVCASLGGWRNRCAACL